MGISENYPNRPLKGAEMSRIDKIENAYLSVEGDTIIDYGMMSELESFLQFIKIMIIFMM